MITASKVRAMLENELRLFRSSTELALPKQLCTELSTELTHLIIDRLLAEHKIPTTWDIAE